MSKESKIFLVVLIIVATIDIGEKFYSHNTSKDFEQKIVSHRTCRIPNHDEILNMSLVNTDANGNNEYVCIYCSKGGEVKCKRDRVIVVSNE